MSSFLKKNAKVAPIEKGIHDSCEIIGVDIEQRTGNSGIINKLMYTKYAKFVDGKKKAAVELSWWKPDETSEYFYNNLQSMFKQVNGVLECFYTEAEVEALFNNLFDDHPDVTTPLEFQAKKWKKSELELLYKNLSGIYKTALDAKTTDNIRLKVTTNHKGEGSEIPRYEIFTESMSVSPTTLTFSDMELRDHSKAGNMEVTPAANSTTTSI